MDVFFHRSVIRRLKPWLLPLKKKRGRKMASPWRHQPSTRRGLGARTASLLRQNWTDCVLSLTSVALTFSPRPRVRSDCRDASVMTSCKVVLINNPWGCCLVLSVCAELVELRMKLDVPGSAGALTNAADRKLQEGQRVSDVSITTKSLIVVDSLPSNRD